MREHKNDYKSIRSTFVMDDRDKHEFKMETLTGNALPYALRRSFRDFNFRTLTAVKSDKTIGFVSAFDEWVAKQRDEGQSTIMRTDYLMEKLERAGFYKRFVDYFNEKPAMEKQEDFNKWHHATCDLFMKTLQNDYENLCYGKAQKIVNMMFKHLYCLNGAKDYDDKGYFKYCHLTLDSFTLEWFHRNVGGKVGVWSNLRYNEAENEYENYEYYVTKIAEYFNNHCKDFNELSPFQYEFYMWPEMQLELAAEAFYFAWNDKLSNSERGKFKEESLDYKLAKIKELLNTPEEIKAAFETEHVICFGIAEGFRGKRKLLSDIWEVNPDAIIKDVDLCVFSTESTVFRKQILVIDKGGDKESGNRILELIHKSGIVSECYVSFKGNNCGTKRCVLQKFDHKTQVVKKMNLLIDGDDLLVTVRHLSQKDYENLNNGDRNSEV